MLKLALDDADRPQLDALFADSGRVTGVHHVGHVLVRLGRFFHDQFGRRHPDGNALLGKFVQDFLVIDVAAGLGSGMEKRTPKIKLDHVVPW